MSLTTKIKNKTLNHYRKTRLKEHLFEADGSYGVKWINFEFCSACNLRCKWCSLDHDKKTQLMTEEILRGSLDQIISDKNFKLDRIDLHNAGETLMHPRLGDMLGVIAGKKKLLGGATVHLLTNGVLLNEKRARVILDSNALDELRISIDGGTREGYGEIRIGSDWETVSGNVNNFFKLNNGRIKTAIICIVPPDKPLSREWMDGEFQELFDRVDSVDLRYPHNWDGSKDLDLLAAEEQGSPGAGDREADEKICKMLIRNLVVLPNGDVTVCCADLNSRGVVGNVQKASLTDIFFSEKRLEMIDLFAKGQKSAIDLCKNCAGFYE